jgi:hypothetical protein
VGGGVFEPQGWMLRYTTCSFTPFSPSPRAGHRNVTNLKWSQHTDMTIHWKALEEHFLMVPLNFDSTIFRGKSIFLIFLKMPNSLRDNSTTGLYVGAAVFKMFNRI